MTVTSAFKSKKGKVIIVDPSSPVRQMATEQIRAVLGFSEVEGRPSIEEVVRHLEVDTAAWILTPLMADQTVNAMHLLKLCVEQPELRNVRVSLLLDESEEYALPSAFELGCLSNHPRSFTKESLVEELQRLSGVFEDNDHRDTLVAAEYLRRMLRKDTSGQAELELAKSLLATFPGDARVLMAMAEPQFKLGQKDLAKKTLASVKMLEPRFADRADAIGKQLFGDGTKIPVAGDIDAGDLNYLGAENAVVIDSDETIGMAVTDILNKLGIKDVKNFANGEEAFKHIASNPEPQLIVTEWRLPGLAAPMLLQRVRAHGYLNVPIVVLSSLLKPVDMPLVREMGVAGVIAKPLNKDLFIPSMIGLMTQDRAPTDAASMERKIRQLLASNKKDDAAEIKAKFVADPHVAKGKKILIEAEWAFANGQFTQARDLGAEALKLTGEGFLVLNLLGKTFMKLASYESALKCFKKAQEMSPNNLERLCSIAETSAEIGDQKAASEAMNSARALDPDSKTVAEGEVKVALATGDADGAKELMKNMDSLGNIVGYMNNKAVAHARCGLPDEALEIYNNTVKSIPDDKPDYRAVVLYNMALAQVRRGELEGAMKAADEALTLKSTKVAKKAKSLRDRIKAALDKGLDFKLQGEATPEPSATSPAAEEKAELDRRVLAGVELKRGDLCCFLVYSTGGAADARAESLLAKPPRFKRREAIERSESMGGDKAMKETA